MAKKLPAKERKKNPFYYLLILVGLLFAATATAYGVMSVVMLNPQRLDTLSPSSLQLLKWIDANGVWLLLAELAALAIATFLVIGLDTEDQA